VEKARVAMFDSKSYDVDSFQKANKEYGYEISFFKENLNSETAVLCQDHNVVCPFVNDTVDSEVIDILKSKGIKLITLRSAGYNNVDLKAVYKKIHVMHVPQYSPYAVAEHAAALMLALNRKTHRAFYRTRDSNFSIEGLIGFDMRGKTAGVIGTGKIGRVMIDILTGFGMNIVAYDPYADEDYAREKGFKYVEIQELYGKSDIITLHCPLTKGTYHIINSESLSRMKDGVMIVNTGRGQLIDTRALIKALKEKKVSSAGLDVYEEESEYFFEDFSSKVISDDVLARLLTFPNVLVTSHQGFFTREALNNIADTTLQNIKKYFNDEYLDNEICYRCENTECVKKKKGRCF